ncbi:MAG: hypothetical protein AB1555_15520 [Nitrospirota bacterium]
MDKFPQWTHTILMCEPGVIGAVTGVSAAIALKTYRPECRVTCVVSGDGAPILERHPAVDQTLSDLSFPDLVAFFRRQSPGSVLLLTYSPGGFVAAMLARVPVRICCDGGSGSGTIARMLAGLFGCRQAAVEASVPSTFRIMGLPSRLPPRPWIVLTPRERRRAQRRLRALSRPRVFVHPSCLSGAMGLLNSKWNLVLAGLKRSDQEPCSLAPWLERGALDLLFSLSLREWLAVLAETDVLVSADEESLVLAEAMGVPAVRVAKTPGDKDVRSVLPEAVAWQVEAILRHRLRIVRPTDVHQAGVV